MPAGELYPEHLNSGMGYDSRSPLLPQMQQNYPPFNDSNQINAGKFSTSKIEEMSMNFKGLNTNLLNQPAIGGQATPPIQHSGPFGGMGGFGMDNLNNRFAASTNPGGFGNYKGNPPTNPQVSQGYPQVFTPQPVPSGRRTESNDTPSPKSSPSNTQPVPKVLPSQYISYDGLLKSFDKEASSDIVEEWKNKVKFSLNNCSNSNIEEKSNEIRSYLTEEKLIQWFAKYIVYQRAPLEANFHSMYINLVSKIGKKEIFTIMIKETCSLLNKIIEYNQAFSTPERLYLQGNDKNSFKNLGSWLGLLTIGRNKPIVIKDFDVKTIIVEGYESQKLDYILPLVCKILAHGSHPNSVFKPKNAWMNAILSLLSEVGQLPEIRIKITLKCEIQLLLNHFGLKEEDIIPSKILSGKKSQRKKEAPKVSENQELNGQNKILANESHLTINELPEYVTINPSTLNLIPNLKSIVAGALDRAIK